MKNVWRSVLAVLGAFALLYTLAMPFVMGGFTYGFSPVRQSSWQAALHYGHRGTMAIGGFGSTGSGEVLSGVIELGLLVFITLGIIWFVSARARQDQKRN